MHVVPAPPWRPSGSPAVRLRGEVHEVRAVAVDVSPQIATAWVQEIANIALTEVKADVVEVHPDGDGAGTYEVRGRFAGVPWQGVFRYVLRPDGFHSVQAVRQRMHPQVSGGFTVVGTGDSGCVVVHYEQYLLRGLARVLRLPFAWYIRRSMRRELDDLAHLLPAPP